MDDPVSDGFLEQTQITFPAIHDNDGTKAQLAQTTQVSPYPLDVIVGPDGTIAHLAHEYNADELRAAIEGMLLEMGVTDFGMCTSTGSLENQ